MDVVDLGDFYTSRLGHVTRRLISRQLHAGWDDVTAKTVLGLGYTLPYLDIWKAPERSVVSFMPARLGATHWPRGKKSLTAMVENTLLPLEDSSVDFAVLIHALELSHNLPGVLAELWRVMNARGRVLIVTPNRRGMWARFDSTPFGHGRPFSRRQLTQSLRTARFVPTRWKSAVFIPPYPRRFLLRSARAVERTGQYLSPGFGGVLMVEATKQVYSPVPRALQKARLADLAPQPAAATPLAPHSGSS